MEFTDGMKEVRFDVYCATCERLSNAEDEEPCYSCLAEPVNQYSHKPVKWEESAKKKHESR